MGLIDRFRRAPAEETLRVTDLDDPGNIRRALWLEQFDVHFQPIVDVESGALAGVEALVRWEHPDVGVIPAQRFVPIAERAGLLLPLDVDTLRTASAFRRDLSVGEDRELRVTLNLGTSELLRPELTDTLRKILDQTGLPTEHLEVELSEDALRAEPDTVSATVRRLHEAGISISIDDFGSNEALSKLLNELPVDRVKVDLSTIPLEPSGESTDKELKAHLQARNDAEARIEQLVKQARASGFTVGAKRVESIRHLRLLRDLEITHAQGYVLGRPVSRAEFGEHETDLEEIA